MREIQTAEITQTIARLTQQANSELPDDVLAALRGAREAETSDVAVEIIDQLIRNAEEAKSNHVPICQDCGLVVVFAEIGADAHIDGDLYRAIDEGVREGYESAYLRKSVISDPLRRDSNTGDNTPAIVHIDLIPGSELRLTLAPKGGGSENMSRLEMLVPAAGEDGVVERIAEWVVEAGGRPCPPLVLGVGIGGTMEKAAIIAKQALMQPIDARSDDPQTAALEERILQAVNDTGVGPMGLGGKTTALAVHVNKYPCHIASLPLALNLQCHAARHASAVI